MKNFVPTTEAHSFTLYFIDFKDKNFCLTVQFSTVAPHYEGAVAQALACGQQISRDMEKEGRCLFMRLCKA